MKKVNISPELLFRARVRDSHFWRPPDNPSVIEKNRGTLVGLLAEEVFQANYPKAIHIDVRGFDFILPHGEALHKIEIKSMFTRYTPSATFNCAIPEESVHRIDPEALIVFMSILEDHRTAWFTGWIHCEEFLQRARKHRAGDPGMNRRGDPWTQDCRELRIEEIRPYRL